MAGRAASEAGPSSAAASAIGASLKELAIIAEAATLLPAEPSGSGEAEESEEDRQARRQARRDQIRGLQHAAVEAMYQLEDALDSYNSMVAQRKQRVAARRSILHPFRSSSPAVAEVEFRKVEANIEKLGKETHEMLHERDQLGLQLTADSETHSRISNFRTSIIPKYDITGDAEQEKQVISMLTDNQSSSHVVLVVGCGGTGKTTLARNVSANPHTRNAFSTIRWVQGSKHFSHMELLSAIASAAGLDQTRVPKSAKKVEEMLASMLEGKRFLLVLDDVWSHQVDENFLKACLPVQHGSRILMTTRDKIVAERMSSTARTHHVKELDSSQCWSLLCKIACLDSDVERCDDDNPLRLFGIAIIQNCRRVPLAIHLMGGLLRTKDPTLEEWRMVSQHEGWHRGGTVPEGMEGVAGAIQVAYCDLPPHLKQCFRYCFHLPEGFQISKQTITQLWISEGFVEEQDGCNPQDTAEEYYMELVLRNLLRPDDQAAGSSHDLNTARCTLNGCVRSVLRLYTKDLWIGNSMPTSSSSTPNSTGRQERTTYSACFRTAILSRNLSGDRVLHQVSKDIRYLRALHLTGAGIRHIPAGPSLEPLLHLRFLNLSRTEITELPESIVNLRNLQFLVLRFCCRLQTLPGGISKLHNLQALDLEGTEPCLVLPSLAGLEQLTTLHGFLVNCNEKPTSGWPLEDLRSLNSLRSLQIVKVEQIQSSQGADLSTKRRLTRLELCGSTAATRKVHAVTTEEEESGTTARLDDVLDSLQPPQCLESLKVQSYQGRSFPSWVQQLLHLQRLVLYGLSRCASLPALGQLPELKLLVLSGCSELRAIQRGPVGPPRAFPALEQLHLDDMWSLESWDGFEDGDLPSLEDLRLQRCPRLRSLPSCLGGSKLLTSMTVASADSLEAIDGLAALRKLVVRDSERLVSISGLPELEALTVTGCSALRDVSGLKGLRHLRFVHGELTRLPGWLRAAGHGGAGSVPEALAVVGGEELLQSLVPGGEDWPAVSGIGKVYGNLPDESPLFTYTKSTGVLQALGERRKHLVASSEASLQPKTSSRHFHIMTLRDYLAGRIAGITGMTPARKCLWVALVVAASLVFLKLPAGYAAGPIPAPILIAFFAATACFLYFFSHFK